MESDRHVLLSLSLTPGLDDTTTTTTTKQLSLVWPLTDFVSTQCSRPVATILRFLHFQLLNTSLTTTTPPTVLIDVPQDTQDQPPELCFVRTVQEACSLLKRPFTLDSTVPFDVVVSFFPTANQDHSQHLSILSTKCLGPMYVLCGDCEALGMPLSAEDEMERGLDSLRVEMLLKQTLSSTRESGASIAVEYARGGEDARNAREQNCALRRHQREQLVGDSTLLLLSEKWQIFTRSKEDDDIVHQQEVKKCIDINSTRSLLYYSSSTCSSTCSTELKEQEEPEERELELPLTEKMKSFGHRLRSWFENRLALWSDDGSNKQNDDETVVKLMQQHSTREGYELYLRNAVEKKWMRQTQREALEMWLIT
jgi:hypothetical protein